MAEKWNKTPKNVDGKYYVEQSCIDCGLCYQYAPNHFSRDQESEKSHVFNQPKNNDEIAKCEDALTNCPVNAIGNDG